jgi:hypothetical protein
MFVYMHHTEGASFATECRNADLETILATDLSQLGQVPKLQALALSALRAKLSVELESLLRTLQPRGVDAGGPSFPVKGKADDGDGDASQRSSILDGSPKSTRPQELAPYERSALQVQSMECASAGHERTPTPLQLQYNSMVCAPH